MQVIEGYAVLDVGILTDVLTLIVKCYNSYGYGIYVILQTKIPRSDILLLFFQQM